MTLIRCVIVDDEPLARSLTRTMLALHDDVQVVAECGDGLAALETIRREKPDAVFLDIQMPGMNGLDVAEALGADRPPAIVFVTAYDEYALRAFDVHAIDYLLKPFDGARLQRALERARAKVAAAPDRSLDEDDDRLSALLLEMRRRERLSGLLAIREGERTFLQPMDEIDWIEAEAKYMRIHVQGRSFTMRETMKNLEDRLDPGRFLRVSRSAIVNLYRIREIQPWFNGEFMLILASGAKVPTTRAHRDRLAALIGR